MGTLKIKTFVSFFYSVGVIQTHVYILAIELDFLKYKLYS